ncbi:hypothetical protein BZA70DRAFT_272008, partial [Myxozyma melibiosi]
MSSTQDSVEVFAVAIAQLPLDSLHAERARLENSVEHLLRSNSEIQAFIDSDEVESAEEQKEFEGVIKENEEILEQQKLRIEMVKSEISQRS